MHCFGKLDFKFQLYYFRIGTTFSWFTIPEPHSCTAVCRKKRSAHSFPQITILVSLKYSFCYLDSFVSFHKYFIHIEDIHMCTCIYVYYL